ncbi:3-methyl-2-oxobutanoate dehydrogenase subunit alpha [Acidipropionibacterium virtanenii]|uniref:2-oxoisovalerate dehydrogenase subunit alpha n=2 Tax=Acidipropionibacterium virtanenii TaxID=2057246 RepID=A0A344UQN6_9ACTN|nr:thiamine pyrophosphate-dependent enzyme [Acidipropionibacterium virtanenii]AXE37584.1 3-methyl-2-oxobutanoate dehydrogenase subunit alpha [Acidipropionibacterium virtanenii]
MAGAETLSTPHPVDQPDPSMVQLLSPEGVREDSPDYPIDLSPDQLRQALERMVMARRLDVEGTNLQRHGELGLWPPLIGQEATQAGAMLAIGPNDQVFPTYREQGLTHWKGVSVADILATWRGSAICPWDTVATHCSAYPVMIGSSALHGVGYAMGIQRDGMTGHDDPDADAAVLLFHGDGSMSEGDVSESYVFAAATGAPIVFCCINNQYAISERTTVSARTSLFRRAAGFGLRAVQVDGNDAIAVAAVLRDAMRRARNGEGPTFVEAWTYRMGAHTTTDDPTRYRTKDEEQAWAALDPISRLRAHLLAEDLIDDDWLAGLDGRADEFGASVRAAIDDIPEPDLVEELGRVYVDPTPDIRREQQELAEWLALDPEEAN